MHNAPVAKKRIGAPGRPLAMTTAMSIASAAAMTTASLSNAGASEHTVFLHTSAFLLAALAARAAALGAIFPLT